MKVTLEQVKEWDPYYTDEKLAEIAAGRTEIEVEEIADLPIQNDDKIWLLFREEILGFETFWMASAAIAERVLPIWEDAFPDDDRPRKAIEARRAYAHGEISMEELQIAADAARVAADLAIVDDLNIAANYAALAAGMDPSYIGAITYDAAYAIYLASGGFTAERWWQLEYLMSLVSESLYGDRKKVSLSHTGQERGNNGT